MSLTGGGDSGVETECEVESNDSFVSTLSVTESDTNSNMAAPALPRLSSNTPAAAPALPSHPQASPQQEDGYLGDCSSDGGNEKNFPLPPDWSSSRVSLPSSPGHQSEEGEEVPEPPAGLAFSALAANTAEAGPGYHVLPSTGWAGQSSLRTKVRQARRAGFRSHGHNQVQVRPGVELVKQKSFSNIQDDWSKVKKTLAERKLRSAANTNNSDLVEQLLSSSSPDVNSQDELKRSALHFAAAKVVFSTYFSLTDLL